MLRFRRYRVFLICAILLTILLVKLSRRNEWGGPSFSNVKGTPSTWEGYKDADSDGYKDDSGKSSTLEQKPLKDEAFKERVPIVEKPALSSVDESSSIPHDRISASSTASSSIQHLPTPDAVKTIPDAVIPDRTVLGPPSKVHLDENDEIPSDSPVDTVAYTTPTPIHWEKQVENFPVPPESIIHLPSGMPKPIPKIQFSFRDETVMDRAKRLKRQDKVKVEFKRAWNGYKSQAWMHDEVRPVSGEFRDPFGGWAATLVDSLDTLWIMGLEEDFEEAVRAVGGIDFTTSTRSDIQVFETVIRYLGGLIGAYDVSGGTRRILLDKAVELAEVLMGVFDTPNRMPDLFYKWKPAFSSQPHRARSKSNLAELGTLSMEFTRLAQLTREAKYYDAIARITDALEDWQNKGTNLPGVFPSDVDASGCNRTLPPVSNSQQSPTPLPPNSSSVDTEMHDLPPSNLERGKGAKETTLGNIELTITEGLPGEPGKAHIQDVQTKAGGALSKLSSRSLTDESVIDDVTTRDETDVGQGTVKSSSASLFSRFSRTESDMNVGDWDCVPQGLTSANHDYDTFSMGGGQDSMYEYLPKQYMLLGGLEDKYRTMYLEAMEAVRKNMLYRPMLPNNRDVRFTGKVTVIGSQDGPRLDAEINHLTCFVGGMFGMASKIFDIEGDLEIAEKLSDGCVWAYESTASGIMPEAAELLPCESMTDCPWNQTLWEECLDPTGPQRDESVKIYNMNRAEFQAKAEQQRIAAMSKLEVEENEKSLSPDVERPYDSIIGSDSIGEVNDVDVDSEPPPSTRFDEDGMNSTFADQTRRKESFIQKRDIERGGPKAESGTSWPLNSTDKSAALYQTALENTKLELDSTAAGREVKTTNLHVPQSQAPTQSETFSPASRPMSHKEYVEYRIQEEGIPDGFLRIRDGRYILRPEAIESVWYMYRITGDSSWQEKGWKMFEHIIDATSTTYGHSAVRGITRVVPTKADEMESFWLAETLKYFYLLYSTPDEISLDDYVLNTEAHPFKRPK